MSPRARRSRPRLPRKMSVVPAAFVASKGAPSTIRLSLVERSPLDQDVDEEREPFERIDRPVTVDLHATPRIRFGLSKRSFAVADVRAHRQREAVRDRPIRGAVALRGELAQRPGGPPRSDRSTRAHARHRRRPTAPRRRRASRPALARRVAPRRPRGWFEPSRTAANARRAAGRRTRAPSRPGRGTGRAARMAMLAPLRPESRATLMKLALHACSVSGVPGRVPARRAPGSPGPAGTRRTSAECARRPGRSLARRRTSGASASARLERGQPVRTVDRGLGQAELPDELRGLALRVRVRPGRRPQEHGVRGVRRALERARAVRPRPPASPPSLELRPLGSVASRWAATSPGVRRLRPRAARAARACRTLSLGRRGRPRRPGVSRAGVRTRAVAQAGAPRRRPGRQQCGRRPRSRRFASWAAIPSDVRGPSKRASCGQALDSPASKPRQVAVAPFARRSSAAALRSRRGSIPPSAVVVSCRSHRSSLR